MRVYGGDMKVCVCVCVCVCCRASVDNSSIYDELTELPYWNKAIYLSVCVHLG